MSIYSKPAKIAVRILTQMVREEDESLQSVREVSDVTQVSRPTVAKVLQSLARDGILESRKGPGGGFRLALSPKDISLRRIVSAIEGEELFPDCIGGFDKCTDEMPCPLHEKWIPMRSMLLMILDGISLHELVTAKEKMNWDE